MDFEFDNFEISGKTRQRKSEGIQQRFYRNCNPNIVKDKLDKVENSSYSKKSNILNVFDQQESLRYEGSNRDDFNQSRNIQQISYLRQKQGNSFRFQNHVQNIHHPENSRYERLQKLLNKAQNNSFSTYSNKELINQKPYTNYNFQTKQQFKDYIKSIKQDKKKIEDQFKSQILKNKNKVEPLKDQKLSKAYDTHYQGTHFDFSKKPHSNSFLPQNFLSENFDDIEDQKPPQPKQFDGIKQARQFFDSSGPSHLKRKQGSKKPRKQSVPLEVIRQEKPTIFEKTIQQQRLNLLINNYQDMRSNFDDLMSEFKEVNQDEQKFANIFNKMKEDFNKRGKQQQKQKKKILRNQSHEIKKQQFQQIKEQINKIKQSNKDLLFKKINSKILTVQSAVKTALDQIAGEKEHPYVHQIPHYYQSQIQYNHNPKNQFMEESIVRYAEQKSQTPMNKYSRTYMDDQNFMGADIISQEEYYEDEDIEFIPADFSQQYLPKKMDSSNRNIRKSLTQKSSLVYQSLEFTLAAKFLLLDDHLHPLMIQIKLTNICQINFTDVFVVVYSPQGFKPIVNPPNIYLDVFQPDVTFTFEVFLNKECLDECVYVQMAYKCDILAKKQVNIKVPIPILRLIRPQFIYQEQFSQAWNLLQNQLYIAPKTLDFMHIRSHQDIKFILPFTHISEGDPNIFSYGIMFRYQKSKSLFLMKIYCFINGKASVHLRTDQFTDFKVKEQLLDVMNFLLFSS